MNQLKLLVRVILTRVGRMLFVKKETELGHVSAFLNILETPMTIASQSALVILIAIGIKLASIKSVAIHAQEFAEIMQCAMSLTIRQAALA